MNVAATLDTTREHNLQLDGARGVAALMVFLFHLRGPIGELADLRVVDYLLHLFSPLWAGVDLFFVLSGFLITNILIETRATGGYFRNFYGRRTLRIFPLFYFTLIAYEVSQWVQPDMHPSRPGLQIWYWLYAQNWLGVIHNQAIRGFEHYWSLAIEEQFYLLWPVVVLLVGSPRRGLQVCLSVVVGCLLLRVGLLWLEVPSQVLHYSTTTRIDALLAGGWLAYASRVWSSARLVRWGQRAVVIGSIGFIGCALSSPRTPVYGNMAMQSVGYTLIAAASTGLIAVAVGSPESRISRTLRHRGLRWVGGYSYGIYVYHWPVIIGAEHLCASVGTAEVWRVPLFIVVATVTTFGVAALSYHILEHPFLRLKRLFVSPPRNLEPRAPRSNQ